MRQQCDDAHDEATVNGPALDPRNRILEREDARSEYEAQRGDNGRFDDKDREESVVVGRPGNDRISKRLLPSATGKSDVLDTSWVADGAAHEVPEELAVDECPESCPKRV